VTSPLLGLPPTLQDKVREWKETYQRVYLVTVEDDGGTHDVVLRGLSKREADMLDGEPDEVLHMEKAFRLALLHPNTETMDAWSAGAVQHVYECIRNVSGWGDEHLVPVMTEATEEASTLFGAMTAFICRGIPALKPAEVYEMTALELGKHLRMAEYNLQEGFDFERWTDPEAWYRKNRGRMRKVPGGQYQEMATPGDARGEKRARINPEAAAQELGTKSYDEIMNDPNAIDLGDPDAVQKMIRGFTMGKGM